MILDVLEHVRADRAVEVVLEQGVAHLWIGKVKAVDGQVRCARELARHRVDEFIPDVHGYDLLPVEELPGDVARAAAGVQDAHADDRPGLVSDPAVVARGALETGLDVDTWIGLCPLKPAHRAAAPCAAASTSRRTASLW